MSSNSTSPVTGPEILLAEDEEHIAKLVSFVLTKAGYVVKVARNGKEATDALFGPEGTRFALLILDVMMPIKDGWQVMRELRSSPAHSTMPVLLMTAKGNQRDLGNASELRVSEYLTKPFDPQDLKALVARLTAARKAG